MTDEFARHRHTARTAAGEVSYLDVGAGPVTLFVHGVLTNALLWRHCLRGLAAGRRCIAVDLPGHGHTPPGRAASVWGLADAVNALIRELDLTEVHLVGNDTGGAVCQVVYARDPGRFASLVLTDCDTEGNFPPPAFRPVVFLTALGALRLLRPLRTKPALLRQLYRTGYQDPSRLPLDIVTAYVEPVLGSPAALRFQERLLLSMHSDQLARVRPALADCRIPVALVWGTGDGYFPLRWAHWLHRLIPGATEVVPIPGGRLFFVDERADELLTALRAHWGSMPD